MVYGTDCSFAFIYRILSLPTLLGHSAMSLFYDLLFISLYNVLLEVTISRSFQFHLTRYLL